MNECLIINIFLTFMYFVFLNVTISIWIIVFSCCWYACFCGIIMLDYMMCTYICSYTCILRALTVTVIIEWMNEVAWWSCVVWTHLCVCLSQMCECECIMFTFTNFHVWKVIQRHGIVMWPCYDTICICPVGSGKKGFLKRVMKNMFRHLFRHTFWNRICFVTCYEKMALFPGWALRNKCLSTLKDEK